MSEMLRYRRLCNSQRFVDLNERQLFTELLIAGYSKAEIKKESNKSRDFIKRNYTQDFVRKINSEDKNENEAAYYGKLTFDNYSGSHKIIQALMKGAGKSRIKMILVPSLKIKTYIISRKKHLKRLRNFITNKTL